MGSASSRKEEGDFEESAFGYIHGELASFQDLEPPSNARTTSKSKILSKNKTRITSPQFANSNVNSSPITYAVHAEQNNEILLGLDHDSDNTTPESNKFEENRKLFGIQNGQYSEHTTELYEVDMVDEKPTRFLGPIRYGKLGLQRGRIREEGEKEGIMGTVPVLEMNPDVILQELRRAGLVKQTTRGATYDIDIYVVPRPACASPLPPLETDVIIRKLEEKEKRHRAQIEKNDRERQEKSRKLKDRHRLAKMRRSQQIKTTENIELN